MGSETDAEAPQTVDASRRTWLAAERTWLAWWRTGVAAAAAAIALGRIVPSLSHGARWPFSVIGIAYGLLAVAVLVIGAVRQRETADALRRGSYAEMSSTLVSWLTVVAIVLSLAAVAVVAIRF